MARNQLSSNLVTLGIILASLVQLTVACGSDDVKQARGTGGTSGSAGKSATGGGAGTGGKAGTGGADGGGGTSGSGGSSAGSAGTDGSAGAQGAAGADAGPKGTYVDCANGSDTNPGTETSPFKTIAKSASVASSGEIIWLLDGVCDKTTEPDFNVASADVDVPDGVTVKAVNSGAVTLSGVDGYRSAGLKFLGSGGVSGLKFQTFGYAISASAGTFTVTETTFDDISAGMPLMLSGTVQATVTPGSLTNYIGTAQAGYADVRGTAKLTIVGGTFTGSASSGISGNALLVAREQGEITLDGVSVFDSKQIVAASVDSGKLRVTNNSLLKNNAGDSLRATETSRIELDGSRIEQGGGDAIAVDNGTPTIVITNSTITGCRYAVSGHIYSNGRPTVTITGSKLNANLGGIYLNYGGIVDISKSEINDNDRGAAGCADGIHFNDVNAANTLKLRETSVQRNCLVGIELDGSAASSFDFGRGNDLGKNVIAGNATGTTSKANLKLDAGAALTVYAAGNTWVPGVQGAAPNGSTTPLPGQFAVTSGNFNDLVGVMAGENFTIAGAQAAASKIRVAENACIPLGTCN